MWPNPEFPADLVTFIEEIFNGKLHSLFSLVIYYFLENATSQTFYRILNVSINIFTKRIFAFYISKVSATPTLLTSHFPLSASVIKTRLPFFDINFGRDTRFSKKNMPCHQHEVPAIEWRKAPALCKILWLLMNKMVCITYNYFTQL